jgi:hypothetical protein
MPYLTLAHHNMLHGTGCYWKIRPLHSSGENGLIGTLPMELTLLQKLRRLDIEDNRVYGTLPSELATLSELENFRCQKNDFFSTFQLIMAILKFGKVTGYGFRSE